MRHGTRVALVCMPFYETGSPSLALGLLKAILKEDGIACDVLYPNLEFALRVGVDRYDRMVASDGELFAGEWAFASAMWEDACPSWQEYAAFFELHRQRHETDFGCHRSLLLEDVEVCRASASTFVEELATRPQWDKYSIVGFSTTFQQNLASLALARSLKTQWPELCVVFGGANCEAEMGARLFELAPFLDAVFVGEADCAFPAFVRAIHSDVEPTGLQNVYQRVWPGAHNRLKADDRRPAAVDLETLPYSDFSDYFNARRELPFPGRQGVYVPFETSRGCWWGQKQHCTFCGLNGERMTFRAKSAERALRELRHLMGKHGDECTEFSAVDNIIPTSYFDTLLPGLAGNDRRLFYETKANLTARQIQILRAAGVTEIQPGVESLNTTALGRMKKGVTAIQNVALLKFCLEYGVYPHWNYLVGFPGETEGDYAGVCDLIRQIPHLTPPHRGDVSSVKFQRFSPYFMRPTDYGVSGLRPLDGYRFVFPTAGPESLRDLCYFFTGEAFRFPRDAPPVAALSDSLRWWAQAHGESALLEFDVADGMLVCDFRYGAPERVLRLPEEWARLYRMFREPRGLDAALGEGQRAGLCEQSMNECLDALGRERLLLIESGRALALTIRLGHGYAPSLRIAPRLASLIDGLTHAAGLTWNWDLRPCGLA